MCGRFTLFAEFDDILNRFDIETTIEQDLYIPSYNIAPSHSVLSVINDGRRNRLGYLRWGFVPSWAKDDKIGYKMINARAETLAEKPSFRHAFKHRRCLVIADSFYEWKKGADKSKTPMRIKLSSDELFAMAGIWERWNSPDGNALYSCSIITTTPNELMKDIHDRMPAILRKEDEKLWLNPSLDDVSKISDLLKPLAAEEMEAYEVSSLVNSPRNNSPNVIQKIC
ncbi:SOS response-associated peptidase [Fredinandcohnia sp. QZ13]|uniref:SOS response-associated peptidase n=1 Tax=Fredinandcohnia sp. QZ13 TaxID=3073144 RepID=UPI00285329D2|nr:SOS response-associated peptidase [Fredinandcohnia sp. QZ13]MDR4886952.1 SOS response-associated peptidase [Fredinandcohnia sp. QZ13]